MNKDKHFNIRQNLNDQIVENLQTQLEVAIRRRQTYMSTWCHNRSLSTTIDQKTKILQEENQIITRKKNYSSSGDLRVQEHRKLTLN
jgi:hypothetical protein